MLKVCDLSSNNSSSIRKQAIAENDAVIVKATEGSTYKNPYLSTDLKSALQQGKKIGVYHYARPERNSYDIEAWNFLKNAAPYIGSAVLVLDWEGTSLSANQKWARQWLDLVYQLTGVKPLLYTSESALKKVGPYVADGDYGLWVAKYSTKEPTITPWKVKALWQYTSTPYDKSHFYGTKTTWDAYAKRG